MFTRLRALWRAFWNSTTAPGVMLMPEPEEKRPMQVHRAALWEAERGGGQQFDQEALFRALRPMPGVLPEGMAFDSVAPSFDALAAYGMEQLFHEGLGFLGYPYLAELSQRAEYRKIASIWAEHCTRKWIKIHGDDEKVKELTARLEDLKVRDLFREAIEKECHFGRMQIFVDFGDWSDDIEVAAPLAIRKEKINPDRPLKAIRLVEPMWSYPGIYGAQDPLAPDFYKPKDWYVSGRRVHSSRLLTLVGHAMPNMLKPAYAFGGVSLTQMCKPYVDNWLRTRQAVSDLVNAFSVMVLATDMDQVLQADAIATQNLFQRLDVFNATRDNRGIFAVNKSSEEFSNVSAPIAGLHELQAQSQEQMSSVSSIPLVILLGITPTGLNASSEGEFRVFYDAILGYNEKVVADPLRQIIDMTQLSLWGEIDPEITFEFESLWEMSDKDKADIRKSDADAAAIYLEHGVVDAEEERERLRNDETSMYHGVNLEGAAPEDNDEEAEDEGDEPDGANDERTAHAAGVMCVLPDGRMLFLRRADDSDRHPGKWCWPGGKIDAGEDAYEAAMREMLEETGFDDVMLSLPVDVRDGFVTFRADLAAPFDPELNGEHTAAVWAHPLDVPGQLHPGVAATLKGM